MRIRARGVVVLGALALALAAAVPASASTWKVTDVPDGPVEGILWAISCPSPSLCVATGTNSAIVSSTDPTGGPSAWSAVHPEGYWLPPIANPNGDSYPGNAIRGVSCPTTGFCAAAGPQGHFFTSTDPTGPAEAWAEVRLGLDATHMNGISCPTPSLCVAVGAERADRHLDRPDRGCAGLDDHQAERALRPARRLLRRAPRSAWPSVSKATSSARPTRPAEPGRGTSPGSPPGPGS